MKQISLILPLFCFVFFACKKDISDTQKDNNAAPVASEVKLTGASQIDFTQTITFVRTDAENDSAAAPIFKWYSYNADGSGKTVIAGATSQTYKLKQSDVGKKVSASVTVTSLTGTKTGKEVESAMSAVIQSVRTGVETAVFSSKTGLQGGNGGWTATSSEFAVAESRQAFTGDGYVQFKIVSGASKVPIYNSAIGFVLRNDWALQHHQSGLELAINENFIHKATISNYTFANNFFRWYRQGTTITLRHCPTENGTYVTVYTSAKSSQPDEAIRLAGGASGAGNGITDAKVFGERIIDVY